MDERPLADAEIIGICVLLFIAGLDTVTSSFSFHFRHLAEHPADQEALRKDAGLIPSAVEELFRAYAVVNTNRYTTRDVEFAGVTMKRGENVTCSTILASRDPREFPNPNEVIFSRSPNLHNAFSYGPHRCLGSHLARREITAGIEEWMRSVPPFRVEARRENHGSWRRGLQPRLAAARLVEARPYSAQCPCPPSSRSAAPTFEGPEISCWRRMLLDASKTPASSYCPAAARPDSRGGAAPRRSRKAATMCSRSICAVTAKAAGRATDYSIDAFAGDVVRVARQAPADAVFVGASIGGIAALIAAGESPEPFARALVLIDVVPRMSEASLDRIRAFMSAGADGFASLEEAAARVRAYLPDRPPRSARALRNNLRTGKGGRLYWHWDPAFHAGSKQRAEAGMLRRMEAATRGIGVPVLLVCGERSEVVDEEAIAHLLRLLPHAKSTRVAGAGHMVAGDRNDAFGAAVLDFLAALPR